MMPALSPEEEVHSRAVAELIAERVRAAGGWLSFEQFMELALYAPGLGYYSAGSVKLGPGGDFATAPEISDLFSRCVARQCAPLLAGGGDILELGAAPGAWRRSFSRRWQAAVRCPIVTPFSRSVRTSPTDSGGDCNVCRRSCASGWSGSIGCRIGRSAE